ncbi:MAG: hypothetical protein IKQ24_05240 [Verrucomicrobia bacterium]|nr:hypothetical protein [Verrucomicrobiota bacterium]
MTLSKPRNPLKIKGWRAFSPASLLTLALVGGKYPSVARQKKKPGTPLISTAPDSGADSQIRTGDLILTKQFWPEFNTKYDMSVLW